MIKQVSKGLHVLIHKLFYLFFPPLSYQGGGSRGWLGGCLAASQGQLPTNMQNGFTDTTLGYFIKFYL